MTECENLVPPYAEVVLKELEGGCSAGEQSLERGCTLVPGALSPWVASSNLDVLHQPGTWFPVKHFQSLFPTPNQGCSNPMLLEDGEFQVWLTLTV